MSWYLEVTQLYATPSSDPAKQKGVLLDRAL